MCSLRLVLTLALLTFGIGAAAQTSENRHELARATFSNLSDEAATCGAYFVVVSQCLGNTPGQQQQAVTFDELADNAFILALTYAEVAGMKREAAIAAAKLTQQVMWRRIENRCENIAILNLDHMQTCTAVMQDPDSRAAYWLRRLEQD